MTRIVTDGAADLPRSGTAVRIVQGPVHVGERPWDEDVDRFWEQLSKEGAELPATEAPSTDQLAMAYAGEEPVLAVHVSGELSRTVEHARQASTTCRATVRVVDSRSMSVGTGLVAFAAAEAARAGVSEARLAGLADEWVDQLHVHALIDDVQFLVNGGRAGLVTTRVSRHAHRHIVAVKGHVVPVRQLRHRADAVHELVEHVREHAAGGVSHWAVGHGAAPDAGDFVERVTAVFGCEPSYVTLLGPPVGAHLGPRSLVVGFFSSS